MNKRNDYIDWDTYFMLVAKVSALRSKDPNTQVGACIIDDDKKIISCGYNGAPRGFNDDIMPWDRDGNFLNTKYAYVCHAELNAILNSNCDLRGTTIYVDLFPCNECAKAIIQSGIKKVIYLSDKYNNTDGNIVAKKMFDECGVVYEKYQEKNKTYTIKL
ncbi:MAG: dCMP deaminase family protein [Bacilli bacterium]|nr:dCMP deaminase family protein [Bacilli bacterium]